MKSIEKSALIIGAIANVIMAFIAWLTYYYSNSEAILLDGNYSFILFLGILAAIKITAIRGIKTKTFPLGQFFYEALYSFVKGLMILGVILMAVITSLVRIISYFFGTRENIPQLIPEPILYYAISVGIICYALSFYYKIQNKKIKESSIILKTEQKASFVDGTLSIGIAAGIFALVNFTGNGATSFIPYLADSFFVLILAALLIKEPLKIIKESVIELAAGSLQNKNIRKQFESIIEKNISPHFKLIDKIISKNGSKYMVILYVENIDGNYKTIHMKQMKENIEKELKKDYEFLFIDIIPYIK